MSFIELEFANIQGSAAKTILIGHVGEKVFQLCFLNIHIMKYMRTAVVLVGSWGHEHGMHHHAGHFACALNPFPLLPARAVMSSRQGVLLLQWFIPPGTTVSQVKKPWDVVKYSDRWYNLILFPNTYLTLFSLTIQKRWNCQWDWEGRVPHSSLLSQLHSPSQLNLGAHSTQCPSPRTGVLFPLAHLQ